MHIYSDRHRNHTSRAAANQTALLKKQENTSIVQDRRGEMVQLKRLQEAANKRSDVQQLKSIPSKSVIQPKMKPNAPIQRMQLIATEKGERENDITVLNNIAFAREVNKKKGVQKEKIGSLFGSYSAKDLDVANGEIVFVHGHGLAGGFRDELSGGDIKDADDEKGMLSWDKTAQIIASKLGSSVSPLSIRMLSCHGAEAAPMQYLPSVNPRGFVDAMVHYMGEQGVDATVTAYNDPVISWGLESGISMKAGDTYGAWISTFESEVMNPIKAELNEKVEDPSFDYQQRMDFIRSKITEHNIDARIKGAFESGALVVNPTITKKTAEVFQGEKVV